MDINRILNKRINSTKLKLIQELKRKNMYTPTVTKVEE
jgi:hypothetical protein